MVAYETALSNRKCVFGSLFYKLNSVNEVLSFAGNSEGLCAWYVAGVGVLICRVCLYYSKKINKHGIIMRVKEITSYDSKEREAFDKFTSAEAYNEAVFKIKKEEGKTPREILVERHERQVEQQLEDIDKKIREYGGYSRRLEGKERLLNSHAYAGGVGKSENLCNQLEDHAYAQLGIIKEKQRPFICSERVESMIKHEFLMSTDAPEVGDIVLYLCNGKPTHAAILKEVREDKNHIVESKWGTIEGIFTHRIWLVPTSYGNNVIYKKKPSLGAIEDYMKKYQSTTANA
jgi:hypothetical protein